MRDCFILKELENSQSSSKIWHMYINHDLARTQMLQKMNRSTCKMTIYMPVLMKLKNKKPFKKEVNLHAQNLN